MSCAGARVQIIFPKSEPQWSCSTRSHLICLYLSENPNQEKQDTFVEKLVTQVIKNLQVKISNIHVRYEDDVSIQVELTYWCVCLNPLKFKWTQMCIFKVSNKW